LPDVRQREEAAAEREKELPALQPLFTFDEGSLSQHDLLLLSPFPWLCFEIP
jgi:hypothetical protein